MSGLLALSLMGNLIVGLFLLVCLALILIVLIQKGRGGGIGAAFGGGGAGSLLGTKTGDFLTWVTICLVALFLVLAVLMGKFMRPSGSSELSAPLTPASVPAEGAASEAAAPAAPQDQAPAAPQDQAPADQTPAAQPADSAASAPAQPVPNAAEPAN